MQVSADNMSLETDGNNDGSNDVVVVMTTKMMIKVIMLTVTIMWRIDPLLSDNSVNSGRC
jgi:hypothetical protein